METFAPRGNIYGPILPQFVLEKPITFGAKIMYALLCNYASEKDHCWPSQATLAARLSCSVSSVKNYLAELVKAKLIDVRREQYRSSVYYMLNPGELRGQEAKVAGQQPEVACPEPKSDYLNNLNKQFQEKNPPLPPTEPEAPKASPASEPPAAGGVSVSLSDFENAWELYPKKDAKGFARVAWLKLQRSGQLPPLDEVRAAIQRFSVSESWQREQGRFVPQMGNWLRGQRWLDPLSPAEETAERERQRREELSRSLQAQQEREKRLQEQRSAERARLRPHFDALAAKFADPLNDAQVAMAFGTWLHLHPQGLAPLASDVPANNCQGIMDFMNAFKRKREEAQYRARHAQQPDRFDARTASLKPCDKILRNIPLFSQLFSGTEQLRQAV
ncbi:conserved hypothetical protein [uncultured delta proteobacterium]|uniref:Helix-turn-helix domain-containing protein n=1 Tax=uncultured delta proteobacterium TaxID=34034 RepID=A0A212K8V2_9DELT|nr:conserved hypothetical protein [uncultured delta proteobacterium]